MNIKQFKKRWLHSKIEPELFYMPVKKETGREPLVFDIYVYNDNCQVEPLYFSSSLSGSSYALYLKNGVYYNLTDPEGNLVTPSTHPNLFHNFPWNDIYNEEGKESKLSPLLVIPEECFVHIDWGDGTFDQSINKQREIQIDSKTYTYSYHWGFDNRDGHTYEKAGRYTITVTGNIACAYFNKTYKSIILTDENGNLVYDENGNYITVPQKNELIKIHQWGDLNLRGLCNYFRFLFNSTEYGFCKKETFEGMPDFNWSKCNKIISLSSAFYIDWNTENPHAYYSRTDWTWNMIGEDFFKNFPNLIDAFDVFYGHQGFTYIPRYLFKNNPYLINLSCAFNTYDTLFEYIGEGACKDLHYLKDAYLCFDPNTNPKQNINAGILVIEDSVFENCYALETKSGSCMAYISHSGKSPLQRVGSKVFKNCHSITDMGSYFQFNLLLEEVGESLFENCYSLQNVEGMFQECFFLKKVGDNIFKGCKSIANASLLFWETFNLRKIPDNLFYDIENVTSNIVIDYLYGCYVIQNWDVDTEKFNSTTWEDRLFDWNTRTYYTYIIDNIKVLQKFYPEQTNRLINSIESLEITDIYWTLGKNMFNPTFLKNLQESEYWFSYAMYEYGRFNYHRVELSSNKHYQKYINISRGEAPSFWKYQNSLEREPTESVGNVLERIPIGRGIFGYKEGYYEIRYYNQDGTIGHIEIEEYIGDYDNSDEIPTGLEYTDSWEALWRQIPQDYYYH